MYGLSENAQIIMQTVYDRYKSDYGKITYLYDLDRIGFSKEELMKGCQELEDRDFVIIEYDDDDMMYLYMLPKILNGLQK